MNLIDGSSARSALPAAPTLLRLTFRLAAQEELSFPKYSAFSA